MLHIPADITYSLDSMHELMNITNDTAYAINLYHSQHFTAIHDRSNVLSDDFKHEVNSYHMDWLQSKASNNDKQLMALALMTGSSNHLEQLFEYISYRLFNGKSDPFWYINTLSEHINFLRPYFSKCPKIEIFESSIHQFRRNSEEIIGSIRKTVLLNEDLNTKKIDHKLEKDKEQSARKAIKKGIQLFKNLFGSKNIDLFLDNKSFIISGTHYDYRFSKKSSLLEYTKNSNSYNIQYELEILSIESGLLYGSLCTVFKDTPIIDQIISVILHIQSGNEEHILENTNVFDKTVDYNSDHYLNNKTQLRFANLGLLDFVTPDDEYEKFKIKNSKSIYMDIMNKLKYNIKDLNVLTYMRNPSSTFDQILDLASIVKDQQQPQLIIG